MLAYKNSPEVDENEECKVENAVDREEEDEEMVGH
jgi:hypothetical protein